MSLLVAKAPSTDFYGAKPGDELMSSHSVVLPKFDLAHTYDSYDGDVFF